MASHTSPATSTDFASSPAGTTMSLTRNPPWASASFAAAKYSGATFESVITSARSAPASAGTARRWAPSRSSTPAPMRTS